MNDDDDDAEGLGRRILWAIKRERRPPRAGCDGIKRGTGWWRGLGERF